MFRCPSGKGCDNFVIDEVEETYSASVYIGPDGEVYEVKSADGGTEWSDDNPMRCLGCGYTGKVVDFLVHHEEEGE